MFTRLASFCLRSLVVILSVSSAACSLTLTEIEAINVTARLEQARFRQSRIAAIQKAILDGLGLETTPTINSSVLQSADAKRMLERFYRISGSDGVPEVVVEADGMDEDIFETILLLAERDPLEDADVIPFPLRMSEREGRVTTANLVMLLKHRRGQGRRKGKRQGRKRENRDRIVLKVYHVRADGGDRMLTKVETTVRHTRWIRLTLPISTIRRALRDGESVLRLRVTCKDCGKRVVPVLLDHQQQQQQQQQQQRQQKQQQQRRRKRIRPRRAAAAKPKTKPRAKPARRRKSRNRQRGPKYGKKWPYLVVGMRANMETRVLRKRDAAECESSPEACCLQRFYVSFRELGWSEWIISPKNYFANYCSGDCSGPNVVDAVGPPFLAGSQLCGRKSRAPPASGRPEADGDRCCRPTSLSALSVLHYDLQGKIVKTDIPNMTVDECGCL